MRLGSRGILVARRFRDRRAACRSRMEAIKGSSEGSNGCIPPEWLPRTHHEGTLSQEFQNADFLCLTMAAQKLTWLSTLERRVAERSLRGFIPECWLRKKSAALRTNSRNT